MSDIQSLLQQAEQHVVARDFIQGLELAVTAVFALRESNVDVANLQLEFDPVSMNITTGHIPVVASRDYAQALWIIGRGLQHQGESTEALRYLNAANDSASLIGDEVLQARSQNTIANIHWIDFEIEHAIVAAFSARGHAQHAEDKKQYALALTLIGMVCSDLDDNVGALHYYNQALSIEQERSDTRALAGLHSHMATAFLQNRQYDEAVNSYREALTFYDDSKNSVQVAGIYCNLALALRDSGDVKQAEDYFLRSLALHRQNDYLPGVAGLSTNLAELALERADVQSAIQFYESAEAAFYTMQVAERLAMVQWDLARLRATIAQHPLSSEQLNLLHQCYARCEEVGVLQASTNREFSEILARCGMHDEAAIYAARADELSKQEEAVLEDPTNQELRELISTLEAAHA